MLIIRMSKRCDANDAIALDFLQSQSLMHNHLKQTVYFDLLVMYFMKQTKSYEHSSAIIEYKIKNSDFVPAAKLMILDSKTFTAGRKKIGFSIGFAISKWRIIFGKSGFLNYKTFPGKILRQQKSDAVVLILFLSLFNIYF